MILHRKGIAYVKGNKVYEGNFKNGIRGGKGIVYDKDNIKLFEGDWKNDMIDGIGIIYDKSENKLFEGEFKNNISEGKGKMYDGQIVYESDFKNFERDGKGIFYLNNGSKINVNYKNDILEEKGILIKDGKESEIDIKIVNNEKKLIINHKNWEKEEFSLKKD